MTKIYLIETTKNPLPYSAYNTRHHTHDIVEALFFYDCINIGRGYTKRLVEIDAGKRKILKKEK